MAPDQNPEMEHHISGLYTNMLMDLMGDRLSPEAIRAVLDRAGETRSLEELNLSSSWNSYDQFKRLLEEAKAALASIPESDQNNPTSTKFLNTEIANTIQAFGSPGAVLATSKGGNPLVPIRGYETTEIGPQEWTIREWFVDGFAPYPEYCEFVAEQFRMIPMFFGLGAGDVVEEECQGRGDSACLFRMRWEERDETGSRSEYFEIRARQLEARLQLLQEMITDLAANERYEDVLQGIVGSTMEAVVAGGALLALEPREGIPRKVYSVGLTEAEAAEIAIDILEGGARSKEVDAVDVASARRHYGVLAIGAHGGLFSAHARGPLETHARLAAAALDAADAMDEARHQANSAQTLLELSTSLAEIVST